MIQEENIITSSPQLINRQRPKRFPPVPKFDQPIDAPSVENLEKKSFNLSLPEGARIEPIAPIPVQNSNKIEEEGKPVDVQSQSAIKTESKEDTGPKGRGPNPLKMPAFVANVDLQFINKLYADKELGNKDKNKVVNREKETKKGGAPVEVSPTIQLQKLRDEYDPARPNDYEKILEERNRRQWEEDERKQREKEKMKEEEEYIPLDEEKPNFSKYPTMEEEMPVEDDEPSAEEKAMRMLEKQGWKMGQGLGKNKQGMTTPLIAKKIAANTAVIENSALDILAALPPELAAKKARESFYNMPPTRVLVLLNMVGPQDVIDEQLRDEVMEEARKYGQALGCEICQMNNVPEDQSIRIFIEYDKKESTVKAFDNLYGRFFAGRTITAKFYDEKSYSDKNLYEPL